LSSAAPTLTRHDVTRSIAPCARFHHSRAARIARERPARRIARAACAVTSSAPVTGANDAASAPWSASPKKPRRPRSRRRFFSARGADEDDGASASRVAVAVASASPVAVVVPPLLALAAAGDFFSRVLSLAGFGRSIATRTPSARPIASADDDARDARDASDRAAARLASRAAATARVRRVARARSRDASFRSGDDEDEG
jgi:hypothetical protein